MNSVSVSEVLVEGGLCPLSLGSCPMRRVIDHQARELLELFSGEKADAEFVVVQALDQPIGSLLR